MRTVLHFSLTALISLSGIFFAVAEGSPLAGLTLIIALATLFFVDLEETFSVPPLLANVLGIFAFIAAGIEFFNGQIESRILAGGHLIVYLTWIFLIQHKQLRHFWWLCALSVLQVATASVLTTDIWFGGALVLYSFVATWTLSVFLLYRSTLAGVPGTSGDGNEESKFVVGDSWKGVSRDVDHRLLNWRFVGITSVLTCLGLLLSLLFFLFTPRVWVGQFSFLSDEASTGRPLTGFTEEVRLGDMGEILENDDEVLEVQLFHTETNVLFTESEYDQFLGAEPLFRGTVMEIYENGSWKQSVEANHQRFFRRGQRADVTQRYRVRPIGSRALFSYGDVTYCMSTTDGRRVFREQYSDELKRDPEAPLNRNFDYEVMATRSPIDTNYAFHRSFWPRYNLAEFFGIYQSRLRRIPQDLPRVGELAESLVRDAISDRQKAEILERYFTDSTEFGYSLDLSIQDASIDPIEDFLFNRKTGHCEYYASAMAIMLRTVGIPSRLISGFKGGNFDSANNTFVVRQLHAHSWVEAFLDGQWQTFDPTPAARSVAVQENEQAASALKNVWRTTKSYWNMSVEMSQRQQQAMIYQPIKDLATNSWEIAKSVVQGRASGFASIRKFLMSPRDWFSLQGGVLAFVMLLLLSGFVWVCKRILAVFRRLERRRQRAMKQRTQVDFYERFLKILNAHGIQQQPTQTAREFVQTSLVEIQPKLAARGMSTWPQTLVAKFYDVRFGGLQVNETDATEIYRRLSELEACLSDEEPDTP